MPPAGGAPAAAGLATVPYLWQRRQKLVIRWPAVISVIDDPQLGQGLALHDSFVLATTRLPTAAPGR